MPRFFASILPDDKTAVIQDPEEVHHLISVLRCRPGHEVELVDGQGVLAAAVIRTIGKKRIDLDVVSIQRFNKPAQPELILACALPKKSKFEDIVDKCTQLGVDEIIPMITGRTEVVVRKDNAATKAERYVKVAMSAVKQSKRLWAPVIYPPMSLPEILKCFSGSEVKVLIPWLEGERIPLVDAVIQSKTARKWLVLIGPEGDFTREEVAGAMDRGAVPVSLGDNVLRVDTAAIASVSILRSLVMDSPERFV